jgi:hypothetical protein
MKWTAVILIALAAAGPAAAADCAQGVEPISDPEVLGYQDRGDRCEGLYVQPVATTGLRIVGFHSGQNDISGDTIGTYVHARSDGRKSLTVISTRKRQYYRMDTTFKGASFFYSLELTRHHELKISPGELVARVCVADCSTLRPTLVPARISSSQPKAAVPFVILQATKDLHRLRIEMTDPATGEVLFDRQLLTHTTWQAWRPAEIPLAEIFSSTDEIVFKAIAQGRSSNEVDSVSAVLRSR